MTRAENEQADSRDERLAHARRTGEYTGFPGGGGIPMKFDGDVVVPLPGYVDAAKRRRDIMAGRMEVEYG